MHDWQQVFMRPIDLRLYVIHTGYVHMNGNIHFNKKSPLFKIKPEDTRFNPVYCYLIAHPQRGFTLIDTGIHPEFVKKSTGNFGPLLGRIIKVKAETGRDVISQIGSIGLDGHDIKRIIMTHLHPDHSSGLPLFERYGQCAVYTDIAELKAANSPLGIFRGYLRSHYGAMTIRHFHYALKLRPFEQVSDFFGDGSVFIVRTSGHTKGHVSVLLNMKEGPVLVPADAVHRRANLEEKIPTAGDYRAGLDSLKRLADFVGDYPETRLLCSHDPDQVDSLKLFPQYYE